jgi:hypothetical protein
VQGGDVLKGQAVSPRDYLVRFHQEPGDFTFALGIKKGMMVTYHFSNSQGAGGRQPKPGKIHRLYEAGGFYVAKRPPPRELDQATMTKQAKDGALVFHKVFSQVTGGVSWIIEFGYVNYGSAREGLPPIFQKGLRYVRPTGSNMHMRPAVLR